jgi:hypothetical protein
MFQRLKQHFTPATFISLIALVFAVSGVSYAATGGAGKGSNNNSLTAHASKSKRGPRGPQGPAGPAGPAGKEGKQGPAGPAGAKGETGATGANGSNGAAGAGVTTATFKTEKGGCKEGGVELLSASAPAYVCNGEESTPGQPGAKGEQGIQGIQGVPGANGESVTSREFDGQHEPTGISPCEGRGGSEFESEPAKGKVKTYACNGKNGSGGGGGGGEATSFGTLEKGKTETGIWSVHFQSVSEGFEYSPISFPIKLAKALVGSHVHYVPACTGFEAGEPVEACEEAKTAAQAICTGTVEVPTAPEGNLCVYGGATEGSEAKVRGISKITVPGATTAGAGTAGAVAHDQYQGPAEENVGIYGTWAVTAE